MQIRALPSEDLLSKTMKLWTDKGMIRPPLPPKLAVASLKLCPLCDSLNARRNHVCFVCGWQGEFIHDAHRVHLSLVLLLEQCPELSEGVRLSPPRRPILARLWSKLTSRFRRREPIDLWA